MVRAAKRHFHLDDEIEDREEIQRWLRETGLSPDDFLELMKNEALLESVRDSAELDTAALLPDRLRVTCQYARLVSRARERQRIVESESDAYPSLLNAGLTADELLRWYFEDRLGQNVPADLALNRRLAGFTDVS